MLRFIHENKAVEPTIPMPDDCKQSNGRKPGQGQRHIDAPQGSYMSRSVYKAGFLKLFGKSTEEIEQQNDVKHGNGTRNDERPDRIQQPSIFDGHIPRYQAATEQNRKYENPDIARTEAKRPRFLGQGVGDHDRQHHINKGAKHHSLDGDTKRTDKFRPAYNEIVRLKREVDRPEGYLSGSYRGAVAKGNRHHVNQRKKA